MDSWADTDKTYSGQGEHKSPINKNHHKSFRLLVLHLLTLMSGEILYLVME